MTDNKEFVSKFVEAAKANDEETMKTLAQSVSESSVQDRVDLLEELNAELKKTEANEEVRAGLEATLSMLRLAQDAAESEEQKDSAGEDAKAKEVKAEEATQDVAADTSAEEAKVDEPEASEEGEAPAKEEKEEKSTSKSIK